MLKITFSATNSIFYMKCRVNRVARRGSLLHVDKGQKVSICAGVGSVFVNVFCVLQFNLRLPPWLAQFAEFPCHFECLSLLSLCVSLPLLFLFLRFHWSRSRAFFLCPRCWILQRCKLFSHLYNGYVLNESWECFAFTFAASEYDLCL